MANGSDDFGVLIPDLAQWSGMGFSAVDWIKSVGTYPLAVGYSLIFWPRFVRFEKYVLREGFGEECLRGFERQAGGNREEVEWVMNHVHPIDLHNDAEDASEAQLRYLGRVLAEIHAVKLRADFPDLSFAVEFNDEPGLDPVEYQMSFWQTGA